MDQEQAAFEVDSLIDSALFLFMYLVALGKAVELEEGGLKEEVRIFLKDHFKDQNALDWLKREEFDSEEWIQSLRLLEHIFKSNGKSVSEGLIQYMKLYLSQEDSRLKEAMTSEAEIKAKQVERLDKNLHHISAFLGAKTNIMLRTKRKKYGDGQEKRKKKEAIDLFFKVENHRFYLIDGPNPVIPVHYFCRPTIILQNCECQYNHQEFFELIQSVKDWYRVLSKPVEDDFSLILPACVRCEKLLHMDDIKRAFIFNSQQKPEQVMRLVKSQARKIMQSLEKQLIK